MPEQENHVFHLGLTMAGAVSAGCYTAGVIDYLFEVLDLWEKAKNGDIDGIDSSLVPKNRVVIDAMGGTSAGGMATIMSALYALDGEINPVKDIPIDPMKSYNVLYDSLVHLDDTEEEKTFSKIWDTSDLTNKLGSLFNSNVIDAIANKALNKVNDQIDFEDHINQKLPSFISPDIEVLISHTLLRGIPLAVNFKTEIARRLRTSPMHNTFEHYFLSHFKLNFGKPVDTNKYLWLNPYEKNSSDKIKLSTISTGAFPVGLAYREFDQSQFNDNYIKSVIKRLIYGDFGKENPDVDDQIDLENYPINFESLTVDGGAMNNEPYREVGSILISKYHDDSREHQDYGLIMIDPFPDNDDIKKEYKKPKSLVFVIPKIIQTLWNQAKVKRKEMLEQYSTDFFKGVIYPRKHFINENGEYRGIDKNPLTSASFNAFGGFLDINFRVHDFFLGRNNTRNFVQFFGSFPYDPDNNNVHPMHKNWTLEMIEKFKIERPGEERIFLPIIPDINLLLNGKKSGEEKYHYDYNIKPKYDSNRLFNLKNKIESRFKAILNRGIEDISEMDKSDKSHPVSDELLKRHLKNLF